MDLNHNSNQFTQPPEVASNGWAQCGDDMKSSRRRVLFVVVEGQALAATNPLSHVLWFACDRRLRAFSAISLAPVPDKRFTAHRSHSPQLLSHTLSKTHRPKKTSVPRCRRRSISTHIHTTEGSLSHPSARQRHPEMANPEAPKPQAPMEARPTSSSGRDGSHGTTGPITQAPVSPHTISLIPRPGTRSCLHGN